jgi:hypothetical protein
MCDIPSEVWEISGEMCRAAADAVEGGCIVTISEGPLASFFMIRELIRRKMACDFLGRKQGLGCCISKWDLVNLGPPCPAYPSTLKIESACSSALLAMQPSFSHCHHPRTGSVSRYFLLLRFDVFMLVIMKLEVRSCGLWYHIDSMQSPEFWRSLLPTSSAYVNPEYGGSVWGRVLLLIDCLHPDLHIGYH